MSHFAQIIKNAALFLFGIFLIVFGFRANMDRAGPWSTEQKGCAATGNDASQATESRKEPAMKAPPDGKTTLERAAPEQAGGSR